MSGALFRSNFMSNVAFVCSIVCLLAAWFTETVSIGLLKGLVDVSTPATKPNIFVNTHIFSVILQLQYAGSRLPISVQASNAEIVRCVKRKK